MPGAVAPVRYWAAAKVPSSSRAVLSSWVRRATSSRRPSTRRLLGGGLLLGGVVLLGRRLRLAVQVVDLLLDLFQTGPAVVGGRGVRRLGEQGHRGEGGGGEDGRAYSGHPWSRGAGLAVLRRQGRRLLPRSAYRVSCRVRAVGRKGCPTAVSPRGRTGRFTPRISVGPRLRLPSGAGRTRRRPRGPATFAGGCRTACRNGSQRVGRLGRLTGDMPDTFS